MGAKVSKKSIVVGLAGSLPTVVFGLLIGVSCIVSLLTSDGSSRLRLDRLFIPLGIFEIVIGVICCICALLSTKKMLANTVSIIFGVLSILTIFGPIIIAGGVIGRKTIEYQRLSGNDTTRQSTANEPVD